MREVPADFFVDIVSQNNFLTQTLRVFFDNVSNCEKADVKLKRKCEQLKQYVTEKFQWNFEDEPEDEAPVIVYLDDDLWLHKTNTTFMFALLNWHSVPWDGIPN